MCEDLYNREANRGVCGKGAHRVKPWKGGVSRGMVDENDEPNEDEC